MANRILADSWRQPVRESRAEDGLLMTTTDAARYLDVTHEAMRRFGLRGVIPYVKTSSPRLRLFLKGTLRQFHEARAEARLRRGQRQLAEVHPVMLKAGLKPRQFDLFGPKLRIVGSVGSCQKASRGNLPTTTARTFGKSGESNNPRYVKPAAAGGRR